MDFAVPFQAGVRHVIANLGTALTEQQVRLLARYTRRVVVNYDPDSAGINATKRSIELLIGGGFKVNVLSLPDGQDPDEYVLRHGAQAYRNRLRTSAPYLDYLVEQSIREHDQTRPAGKAETLNDVVPYLAKVKDRVERAEHIKQVADRLKVEEGIVREAVRRALGGAPQPADATALLAAAEVTLSEKQLLALITGSAGVRRAILPVLEEDTFAGLRSAALFRAALQLAAAAAPLGFGDLTACLEEAGVEDEELTQSLLPLVLLEGAEAVEARDEETLVAEARQCLAAVRRIRLKQQKEHLQAEIRQAERAGDLTRVAQLAQRRLELARLEQSL
jgi:DNA primase